MKESSSGKTSKLSQEDVLRLMQEPSSDARADVVHKITHQYDDNDFNSVEKDLAEQILRFLMHDAEVQVRKVISDNLKHNDVIPRDIVLGLAHDVEEVAIPILEESIVLSEEDLINLIRESQDTFRHVAITKRDSVSDDVSNELINTKNEDVVDSLLLNDGASINEAGLSRIVDQFSDSKKIAESLISRDSVPVTIREKLMAQVSDSLKESLKQKYQIDVEDVIEVVEQSREIATLKMIKPDASIEEVDSFIIHLHQTDRLSSSMVIHALCLGRLTFFIASLARLADIPYHNVITLLKDVDGMGFKSLYEKVKFPSSVFDAVQLVTKACLDITGDNVEQSIAPNRLIEHVLSNPHSQTTENMSYILTLMRQKI